MTEIGSATSSLPRSKRMLLRVGALLMGTLLALVITQPLLVLLRRTQGQEFQDLNSLRSSMLGGSDKETDKDGSTLRAIVNPHPNDRLIYDLRQNLRTTFKRVPVRTSSCGTRGPEHSLTKPPHTYRIALLGDSFAFGWGVVEERIFATRLESKLNQQYQGKPRIEVINFGVPGYSTFQEVETFKILAQDYQPDAVIVFFVDNDFGLPFFVRDVSSNGGILSGVEFAQLAKKVFTPNLEKQKSQLAGFDPNRALRELDNLCRENGIRLMVAINPNQKFKKIKQQLWVLKKNRSIAVPNLRADMLEAIKRKKIDPKDLSLGWDPHPSELKHELLADFLSAHFMNLSPGL